MKHQIRFWFAFFVIAFASLSSAYSPVSKIKVSYSYPKSYFESHADMRLPERERIQLHLAQVENDLREQTPAGLTKRQLAARIERLDSLHFYWVRGEFPQNVDYPDSLVPYFIDNKGIPCAVGYLVISSGNRAFADEIALTKNHAYIQEITDARLNEWSTESGLTLEECARIQPSYGGPTYYHNIRSLDFDTLNRPWIIGGETDALCNCVPSTIAYFDPPYWNIQKSGIDFRTQCMSPMGKDLVLTQKGFIWNGKEVTQGDFYWNGQGLKQNETYSSCAWTKNGKEIWMGAQRGISRFALQADSSLTRINNIYRNEGDTSISSIVFTSQFAWVGNPSGLSVMQQDFPVPISKLDSVTLQGKRVTGLSIGRGESVWVGIDGLVNERFSGMSIRPNTQFEFSTKGLLALVAPDNWLSFRHNNSALPSDTIQAIASTAGDSIWVACDSGLYVFTPPSAARRVTKLMGKSVTTMKVDRLNRLFVGTTNGLFMLEKDSLKVLSYPVVSLYPHVVKKNLRSGSSLVVQTKFNGRRQNLGSNVVGRWKDKISSAGVYLAP